MIRSVSMGEGSAESPENVMSTIIETDQALQAAAVKLKQNQDVQARIDQLQDKIRSREAYVVDLAVKLRSAETILQNALEQTASCVSAIKMTQQSKGLVSVHDLICYASKVAYTSGKIPGSNPLDPFPNHEMFTFSRLLKELLPRKEERSAMEGIIEADTGYSFLGDITAAPENNQDEEEIADF